MADNYKPLGFARRVADIEPFRVVEVLARATELEAAGRDMEKLAQNLFISMSTMAQYAALAGFEPATREILDQRRDIFRRRRDYLLPAAQVLG